MADDAGEKLEAIQVLIRVRPLVPLEIEGADRSSDVVVEARPKQIILHGAEPRHQLSCAFDRVLGPDASQDDVSDRRAAETY